ncbi:hypothetical protein, partial [Pseudomonas sp.]|uniref:hypothetical protein n=1 Tax=Pseudomonas sp. TaxID=306 RepID=UPI003F9C0F6C
KKIHVFNAMHSLQEYEKTAVTQGESRPRTPLWSKANDGLETTVNRIGTAIPAHFVSAPYCCASAP